MRKRVQTIVVSVLSLCWVMAVAARAQDGKGGHAESRTMTLVEAVMCEEARDTVVYGRAVAFSITLGQVTCLTVFDHIEDRSFIYHSWYRQDTLTTKKRLAIKPPRWAAASTIELREADKGPWRVEVSDPSGRLLTTLRFSVVD
jgi:hypothetical protein